MGPVPVHVGGASATGLIDLCGFLVRCMSAPLRNDFIGARAL
jgi:hypothetical protein